MSTPRRRRMAVAMLVGAVILVARWATAADWELVSRNEALQIEAQARPGSSVTTLRARGLVGAPPRVVRAVIADVERYPEFMPYVKESRTLAVEGAATVVYQ